MGYLIISVIILTVVALFAAQNAQSVKVWFLWYYFEASLAVLIFLCVMAGVLLAATVSYSMKIKRSLTKRKVKPTVPDKPQP
jgi:uncharacterized integral membrane protein